MNGPPKHLLQVFRYSDNGDSTLSYCQYNGKLYMYGLEDEYRDTKVDGETRIPAGTYKLGIKQYLTPKTVAYRNRYPWFDKHIQIMGVPNFTDVYIHIGNFDIDTDACYLVGTRPSINTVERGSIQNSVATFKRFYQQFYPLIQKEEVYIQFVDQDR